MPLVFILPASTRPWPPCLCARALEFASLVHGLAAYNHVCDVANAIPGFHGRPFRPVFIL